MEGTMLFVMLFCFVMLVGFVSISAKYDICIASFVFPSMHGQTVGLLFYGFLALTLPGTFHKFFSVISIFFLHLGGQVVVYKK